MFEWLFKFPLDVYRSAQLDYAFAGPSWVLPGTFIIAAALLAFLLWRRGTLTPIRRVAVFAAQLALVAFVLWLLAQPELVNEQPVAGSNTVALVLDDSASMAYVDDGIDRLATARSRLDDLADRVEDTYNVERALLSNTATPVDSYDEVSAVAAASPLASELATLVSQQRGESLAAVVVASDGLETGADNTAALETLQQAGVPIFALTTGRQSVAEDLALVSAEVPTEAVAGSRFDAIVTIRHDRGGDARLRVLANGDTLLAAETVELDPARSTTQQTVNLTLTDTGFQSLSFELTPLGDEQERRNNRLQRVVDVPERNHRILYFEGEPRWEYKFMRRAIAADDDIVFSSLLRVSPNKFYRQGLEDSTELADGFPTDAEELYQYDAVLLGSVEAAALAPAQQQLLLDFVSVRGGSLLLIAGPNGLGNGGWGESALAPALPTQLPAFGTDTFRRERVSVAPTVYGRSLSALRLSDDSGSGWNDLPDIADHQSVGTLKPAAQTLLSVRTSTGDEPLLVTQPYGRGRSYVFGTGGTWRWQMQLPVEDQRHERFWRQLLRTLVTAAPQRESVRAIAADPGLVVEAEFLDDSWQPRLGLAAAVSIVGDGGVEQLALTPAPDQPGVYRGRVFGRGEGIRYLEATALDGDTVVATARAAFAGDSVAIEHRRVRASDTALLAIARASGGAVLTDADPDTLLARLRESAAGVTELRRQSIWDAPAVLLALLLLKTFEWVVRRRWGQI
ncbi:MAG: hypothetical protein AAFZ58_11800 [Pseudomonadota bacterium]